MTTLRLADQFGAVLVGRMPAASVREEIEEIAHSGETVVLDFAGVTMVSPSFADEIFAKVDEALVNEGRVMFVNVAPQLEAIATFLRRMRAA